MDTLWQDLRFAARTLIARPAYTAAAVLCLALGIGANTAIFSIVNAVLLRPLPYPEPDRLVVVWEANTDEADERNVVSPANYLDWRAQSRAFTDIAAVMNWRATVTGLGEPLEVPTQVTTASFFSVLGATPAFGRTFTATDDVPGAPHVTVLSHAFWQRHFGGDRGVLGRALTINGRPFTIIGVMPPDAGLVGQQAEFWIPLGLDPAQDYRETSGRFLTTVGRLRPGVTLEQADRDLRAIAARLAEEHPRFNAMWTVHVVSLREQVVGDARRALLVLAGVVGFVLLIACANVANLQLAQATARQRELAVRAALGASGWRVARQLLTESALLAVVGGVVGLLVAVWGTAVLSAAAPPQLPRASEVGVDARTLSFTVLLTLATGLLFGLVPALRVAHGDLQPALRDGARGTSTGADRARRVLVAAQVALSLVLLVGAGLMLRSFTRLQGVSPGFQAEGMLTFRLSLPQSAYDTPERQAAFHQQLVDRLSALPGVRTAGAVSWLPLGGLRSATGIAVEGRPAAAPGMEPSAEVLSVTPGYFDTMRIPVLRGEPFTSRDTRTARTAVVVDETLAKELFPNEDPLGRFILMPWGDTLRGEIIAVVGGVRHMGLDSTAHPTVYWASPQFPTNVMTYVLRTSGEPMRLAAAARREVWSLDPNLPLADLKPMTDYLGAAVARRRFDTVLLALFAGVALALAAVGIYGVISYSVTQRTREIGVRMALGARGATVLRMIVRQGMTAVAAGVAAGILGALVLTRLIAALLYDVSATDPLTFGVVALALTAVALLASYLPARRATRVDPMEALRGD